MDLRPAPIEAPIEYAHSILHVSDHLPQYDAIHEINALREVFWQRGGQIPIEKHYYSFWVPSTQIFDHT